MVFLISRASSQSKKDSRTFPLRVIVKITACDKTEDEQKVSSIKGIIGVIRVITGREIMTYYILHLTYLVYSNARVIVHTLDTRLALYAARAFR